MEYGEECNICHRTLKVMWQIPDKIFEELFPEGGMICLTCFEEKLEASRPKELFWLNITVVKTGHYLDEKWNEQEEDEEITELPK